MNLSQPQLLYGSLVSSNARFRIKPKFSADLLCSWLCCLGPTPLSKKKAWCDGSCHVFDQLPVMTLAWCLAAPVHCRTCRLNWTLRMAIFVLLNKQQGDLSSLQIEVLQLSLQHGTGLSISIGDIPPKCLVDCNLKLHVTNGRQGSPSKAHTQNNSSEKHGSFKLNTYIHIHMCIYIYIHTHWQTHNNKHLFPKQKTKT